MFEPVCDCCGKHGDLNTYMLRIEKIEDPSIAIRYNYREAEVIPNDRRERYTIKYLLCSHCYSKTGLPLFSFGKNRRFEFRSPLMEFSKCRFCHGKKDEIKNRISMALKDPILQQGFEIICKENNKLESTNAELKTQIEKMKCCGNCAKYNSGYGETPCKLFASGICGEWETSIGKF